MVANKVQSEQMEGFICETIEKRRLYRTRRILMPYPRPPSKKNCFANMKMNSQKDKIHIKMIRSGSKRFPDDSNTRQAAVQLLVHAYYITKDDTSRVFYI